MELWTKGEFDRIKKHTQYLKGEGFTFENREEAYEHYGQIVSILKDKGYSRFEGLLHTFTKEVEDARSTKTLEEFNSPYVSSYLPVVKAEMISLLNWLDKEVEPTL